MRVPVLHVRLVSNGMRGDQAESEPDHEPDRNRPTHEASGSKVEVAGFQRYLNLRTDRKSTRLNSSHRTISYAVFCLKKKRRRWYCHFLIDDSPVTSARSLTGLS